MIIKATTIPNMSPSARSEEIRKLQTCICTISWFGFLDPKNSSVYATRFSTESDRLWAHNIFILSHQETVSTQLELLEVPQSFLQWSVWVLPPFNSRLMENKQGKDNLQEYPLTSNKGNVQWLLCLQEPFVLTICSQMWVETPRLEKTLHLWSQKNKYPC